MRAGCRRRWSREAQGSECEHGDGECGRSQGHRPESGGRDGRGAAWGRAIVLDPPQRSQQIPGRLPALIRILGETCGDEPIERGRHRRALASRAAAARARGSPLPVPLRSRRRMRGCPRASRRASRRMQRGRFGHRRRAAQLFWRHVRQCADNAPPVQPENLCAHLRRSRAPAAGSGQAEVEQLCARSRHHHVRRLEVAVDDACRVRGHQGLGDVAATVSA